MGTVRVLLYPLIFEDHDKALAFHDEWQADRTFDGRFPLGSVLAWDRSASKPWRANFMIAIGEDDSEPSNFPDTFPNDWVDTSN